MGSNGYLIDGPMVGFQTGVDTGIWYEKLHFLADWVSGPHSKGRPTIGFEVFSQRSTAIVPGMAAIGCRWRADSGPVLNDAAQIVKSTRSGLYRQTPKEIFYNKAILNNG